MWRSLHEPQNNLVDVFPTASLAGVCSDATFCRAPPIMSADTFNARRQLCRRTLLIVRRQLCRRTLLIEPPVMSADTFNRAPSIMSADTFNRTANYVVGHS